MNLSVRAFLFDFDGVLLDSMPAWEEGFRQWGELNGFDWSSEYINDRFGRPVPDTVRLMWPELPEERVPAEVDRVEALVKAIDAQILPGTEKLLKYLAPSEWAIASSGPEHIVSHRLRQADLPMPSAIIGGTDVQNGKPHPDPYEHAAKALGFDPSECVVVEDHPAGITAGREAGAPVIALRTSETDKTLGEATFIVDSLASLSVQRSNGYLQISAR